MGLRLAHDHGTIIQACTKYRELVQSNAVKRPDWWDFCAWCGESSRELSAIIKGKGCGEDEPDEGERAKNVQLQYELERFADYIRAQYNTSPAWSGASAGKAIFLQKQDFDGAPLRERQEQTTSGDIKVTLVGDFGDIKDPFG